MCAEGAQEATKDVPSHFSVLLTSSDTEPSHGLEQSLGSRLFPTLLYHRFKKLQALRRNRLSCIKRESGNEELKNRLTKVHILDITFILRDLRECFSSCMFYNKL